METVSLATVHALLEATEHPCVSIVVPAARGAYDQRQARIDLKNLVAQSRRDVSQYLRPHQTDDLLAPAESLLDPEMSWPQGGGGIGMYLSPTRSTVVHIPSVVAPRAMVGERFDVVGLLPVVIPDSEFHVLAISRNYVKLYRATRHHIEEMHLADLPNGLDDALWYERHENLLISHGGVRLGSSAQPTGIVHGGQAWQDEKKDMYSRYFQHIDRVLKPAIFASGAPLVLAAVKRELSGYRAVSHHPRLCTQGVVGNPELLSDSAIHKAAWEAVQVDLQRERDALIDHFNELVDTTRRSVDDDEILQAATQGRVATLLLPAAVDSSPHPQPVFADHADDVVNRAAIETLTHRGEIAVVPPTALPGRTAMAAIFRWGANE